jgi:hypothetical protein
MPWRWKWLGYVAKLTHVMRSSLHTRNMTWSHVTRWRRSRWGLAWWTNCKHEGQVRGYEAINRVVGKLEQRLGADRLRQRWRASEVKIDVPIRSHDDMKWIISFVMVVGACIAWILKEMKWNTQSKGIFVGYFYFTGPKLCREVHDRI